MCKGTILLTAGTGKTSQRMIPLLQQSNTPFLLTSRTPPTEGTNGLQYVRFDYLDKATWPHVFTVQGLPPVNAVYLIAPEAEDDPITPVLEFVQYCVEKGVRRFVMMTGSTVTKGGEDVGKVWSLLDELKGKWGMEYCFIRATWFMENFSDPLDKHAIRTNSKIYSAASSGRIPFIACADIARMAYILLTCPSPTPGSPSLLDHESYRALGPELLSHDEAAVILSEGLSRKIEHVNLSDREIVRHYQENAACSEALAKAMGVLERRAREGGEERIFEEGAVEKVTGKKPMGLKDWVRVKENREALGLA